MLAIAPLWLMLAAVQHIGQTSTTDVVTRDWTQFHRDNMQRWNPYETVLGVNNVGEPEVEVAKSPRRRKATTVGFRTCGGEWGGLFRLRRRQRILYALNASTGAKLWSFNTGGATWFPRPLWRMGWFISAPIGGNVYALNASTGAKLWSYATGDPVAILARCGEWGGLCRLHGRRARTFLR